MIGQFILNKHKSRVENIIYKIYKQIIRFSYQSVKSRIYDWEVLDSSYEFLWSHLRASGIIANVIIMFLNCDPHKFTISTVACGMTAG